MKKKTKKRIIIPTAAVLGTVLVLFAALYIYSLDYYRADSDVDAFLDSRPVVIETEGNLTKVVAKDTDGTDSENIGLIFYPGGKVEARAYLPLLARLAENDITCFLVEMPFNLAVFNIDGADEVLSKNPDIDRWYLAGHSLGGAMASSYIKKNTDKFEGLILLGAYPVNDASVETLAIYGTYDLNLDLEKAAEADEVYEIKGGNHAYFGNYGEQKGDGKASISREEQQRITVERIIGFIDNSDVDWTEYPSPAS